MIVDFGSRRTHRCAETAIDFENRELVEIFEIGGFGNCIVWHDLVCSWRFNAIPVTVPTINVCADPDENKNGRTVPGSLPARKDNV